MTDNKTDAASYREKKAFFRGLLTIYGRKNVLEALQNNSLPCYAVHIADSNREDGTIRDIRATAERREIPIQQHSALARISRNGRQDQGVAADIICPEFSDAIDYLSGLAGMSGRRLLALDGITNPQNLGMIIRSAAAGSIDGIIYPERGCAALGPLVIKASAGTIYRAPLLTCQSLPEILQEYRANNVTVCSLEASAETSLFEYESSGHTVFVLGSESEGVSEAVRALCNQRLSIPMRNGVESLNVAVSASLVAYSAALAK
jgi:23S rRNA (guanosine2251-2'-O)-methyltransferase